LPAKKLIQDIAKVVQELPSQLNSLAANSLDISKRLKNLEDSLGHNYKTSSEFDLENALKHMWSAEQIKLFELSGQYMAHVHVPYPILAQPRTMVWTYIENHGRNLSNKPAPCLDDVIVLLIFALAELCIYDRCLPLDNDRMCLPGMVHFESAREIFNATSKENSLACAQAMVLAALYLSQFGDLGETLQFGGEDCRVIWKSVTP
jgi:hypothetical protein